MSILADEPHNLEQDSVIGGGKYRRIEVKRMINANINNVWAALTEAEQISQWWSPGILEPQEGGRIQLGNSDCADDGLPLDGKIKTFLPPHIFEFTWHEDYDPAAGLVRFELVEIDAKQTLLTVINSVPEHDQNAALGGWQEIAESLRDHVQKA